MRRALGIGFIVVLFWTAGSAQAQPGDPSADHLVSSWTLAGLERGIAGGEATRVPGAKGLLVIDRAGNVFEFFSTGSRDKPDSPRLEPERMFTDFGGFWGQYEADTQTGRIHFQSEAGVSPDVAGIEFTRSYELDDDVLIMTSTNEPQAQADTRWIWRRVPVVENLSPAYREVVGFWRHIDERRVNAVTGEVDSIRERAPSVIVYTPSGFVGVHFPTQNQAPFAGDTPTPDEAEAAFRAYLGYWGALTVYPGEVAHNVLNGVQPSAGAILRRSAEITGDELVVTLDSGIAQAQDNRPRFVTAVHLRRLSGAEDMLPGPR